MSVGPYQTTKTLGSGAFGVVKLAHKRGIEKQFAIKCISKKSIIQARMGDQVMKEISIMKKLDNDFIVKIEDVLMSEDFVYIAMEYAEGGQLWEKVATKGKLSENACKKYTWQMCSALAYCHSRNICHRDIKPQNILLDKNDNIKLADFGFASIMEVDELKKGFDKKAAFSETKRLTTIEEAMEHSTDTDEFEMSMEATSKETKTMSTFCGTISYMAPEIEKQDKYFGDKADVWSLGIVVYVLLNGFMPFKENDVRKNSYKPRGMGEQAQDFLSRMLVVSPGQRWSMSQLLKHPWIEGQYQKNETKKLSPVKFTRSVDSTESLEEVRDNDDNDDNVFEFNMLNKTGLDNVVSILQEHGWKVKQIDEFQLKTTKIDGRMVMVTITWYRDKGTMLVKNANINRFDCSSAMKRLKHILQEE